MTLENENNPTDQKVVNKPETIEVDIFGVSLPLPLDKAKELISKRDERTSVFKDLSEKVRKYETDLSDTKKRLDMAEKVKAGAFEEAEKIANSKLEEKIGKYKSKVIDSEVITALKSNPEFLDSPEVMKDVLKLIKAEHTFELTDDDSVKAGEKDVRTVVNEFLKDRPAYRKAVKSETQPKKFAKAPVEKLKGDLSSGLGKFIK